MITMYTVGKTKCLQLKYTKECVVSLFVELKRVDLFCMCEGKERQIERNTQKDRLINTLFSFSLHILNTIKKEGVAVEYFLGRYLACL